jgi:diguanylate cyclase (GGDEF)-like protein
MGAETALVVAVGQMQAAAFTLIVNTAVAGLFAASYAILALTYPSQRRALWFCASYLIGMLTPLSEFLLPLSPWTAFFMITSYASFTAGILSMAAALAAFYRRPVPWRLIGAIFGGALLLRWLIWGGPRDWLPYEFAYQLPFALAAAVCGWIVLKVSQRRPIEIVLTCMFGLLSLHFLAKPFLAAAVGSGRTARDYSASNYALASQALSGILLIASGLLLLLLVFHRAITESQKASETDPLSGLANRRGFDLYALRIVEAARRGARPVAVVLFDIDHFKKLNDTHGHASGDAVIRKFAGILARIAPQGAVLGRIGGEEFAVLLEGVTEEGARKVAETIRLIASAPGGGDGQPPFTVSAGVAALRSTESLADAMRRADSALYRAKRSGRDMICVAAA